MFLPPVASVSLNSFLYQDATILARLATRLGRNRALFFHDEMAAPEKFRPYDLPSLVWLREVKKKLAETMASAEYEDELERLLLELARQDEAIRKQGASR